MKVLVTGGGGFLGRVIVRKLLLRGDTVRATGRSSQPELEKRGVEFIQGDLSNSEIVERACAGVDAVFHVAAKAGIWGRWEDYYNSNVIGTRNVIDACKKNNVGRLVYTSTPSVVFNRSEFRGADESLPYGSQWLCHYAKTKAIAEEELLGAHDENALRVTALRPHLIWGIGDPHIVPRIIEGARAGKLAIIGDGKNKVDITHVENAADAHLQALDALETGRAGGNAYFISQGEPVALWNWINDLLGRLGEPILTRKISFRKAYAIGATLEFVYNTLSLKKEPPMTRFVAMELSKDHYFDMSAAKRDLGYSPKLTTEDGLKQLVDSYKIRS